MGQATKEYGQRNQEEKAEPVRKADLKQLIETQEYRCALSGCELSPDEAALDHIHAVSKGGKHSIGNLQIVTATINKMKGTLSNEEFISICKLVAKWNS